MPKEKREEDTEMKMMKKIAMIILSICLVLPCFSMVSFAANDGRIMFTDHNNPSVKTGTTLRIKGVVQKFQGNYGKIEITMTYDSSMLNFKNGDNVTKLSNGKIKYVGDGTNVQGDRIEFFMSFETLKAGSTTLKIESATVKSTSGTVLDYEKGYSSIVITGETVAPSGTVETSEETIEIDGVTYTVAASVPQNEIPEGYVSQPLFDKYSAIYNENKNLYLIYVVAEDNSGQLYMYDEEAGDFYPYEEIKVSASASIVLLTNVSNVVLPDSYKQTEVSTMSGQKFPAWTNETEPGFCLVYALNNQGQRVFYRMDTAEGTYQRYDVAFEDNNAEEKGLIDKLNEAVNGHLDYFVIGAGVALLIFIIIIVVLSVKLFNRNAELDEIYEEYGIDLDDETKEDVILEVEDEEEDDDYDYDLSTTSDINVFLQEGMKELFPTEEVEEVKYEPVVPVVEVAPKVKVEEPESTLGAILAQQKEEEEEFFDDDEFDNFSLDFIDLDD